jgi:hypothetical protein
MEFVFLQASWIAAATPSIVMVRWNISGWALFSFVFPGIHCATGTLSGWHCNRRQISSRCFEWVVRAFTEMSRSIG